MYYYKFRRTASVLLVLIFFPPNSSFQKKKNPACGAGMPIQNTLDMIDLRVVLQTPKNASMRTKSAMKTCTNPWFAPVVSGKNDRINTSNSPVLLEF